jgi:sugar/nucleoside kinase (ribokinase family)
MAELIQLEVIVVMLGTGFGNLVLEKVTKWSINHSHIIKKSHIPTIISSIIIDQPTSTINSIM